MFSGSDPTRRSEIREGTCTCRDYEQAPQQLCQHRLSAGLVRRTYELLPQRPRPMLEVLQTPRPWHRRRLCTPCQRLPASVNVRLQIDGREVQWTLRDS